MEYSLTVINKSGRAGAACVFQEDPDLKKQGFMTLAWFAKQMNPSTQTKFSWKINYDFVWAETGTLAAGVSFNASQTVPAELSLQNQIIFDYVGGAYMFHAPPTKGTEGNLTILESANIPSVNQVSVGVGMSGFGTFAHQAGPNLTATYTPHPKYFVTFGTYTQGEVMDATITSPSVEVEFPAGVYSMTAVLNTSNIWEVKPTSSFNAQFLEARAKNPKVSYLEAASKN